MAEVMDQDQAELTFAVKSKVAARKAERPSADPIAPDMAASLAATMAAATVEPKKGNSHSIDVRRFDIVTDPSRDALLTEFGKDTLDDRYLLPGETYQDLFARVASAYSDDQDHAQRIYEYISKLWFAPGDAGTVERRHRARVADLVLPQLGRRQPRRHRRYLE